MQRRGLHHRPTERLRAPLRGPLYRIRMKKRGPNKETALLSYAMLECSFLVEALFLDLSPPTMPMRS